MFLAGSVLAQTNTPASPHRQYNARIQMHATPTTLVAPEKSMEIRQGVIPESKKLDLLGSSDMGKMPPMGPRLKTMQEKQQNKRGIFPLSTERSKDDTTSNRWNETGSSGWGWLADDVRARQQKEKETDHHQNNTSEEMDDVFQSRSVLNQEAGDSKTNQLFLDTTFQPVSASMPTTVKEKAKTKDTVSLDGERDDPKIRQIGPIPADSTLNYVSANLPVERKFGADVIWGSQHFWYLNSEAGGSLPRTKAFLSIAKPNLTKQTLGVDYQGFKSDTEEDAVIQAEINKPEIGREHFNSAIDFQPVGAVPVRNLEETPWIGNLSGKSLFEGFMMSTSEPHVNPSQPLQSPEALELPKPQPSPWLK